MAEDGFSDLVDFHHIPATGTEPQLSPQIPAFDEPNEATGFHTRDDARWNSHWKCVKCESTNWTATSSGWQCELGRRSFTDLGSRHGV